jgi:hypothetical protein
MYAKRHRGTRSADFAAAGTCPRAARKAGTYSPLKLMCSQPSGSRLRYKLLLDGFPIAAKGSRPGRPFLHPEKLEAALLLVEAGLWPTKAGPETGYGRSTLDREIQPRDHA